jgi:hypothetical protein
MSYVPNSTKPATIEEKHKIRKMLEYIGITHPAQQVEFMSALLGKPFDTTRMTRDEFYSLVYKIKYIQENRNKA